MKYVARLRLDYALILLFTKFIFATILFCSSKGGNGINRLFRLLPLSVFPFIASLESPLLEIIGSI